MLTSYLISPTISGTIGTARRTSLPCQDGILRWHQPLVWYDSIQSYLASHFANLVTMLLWLLPRLQLFSKTFTSLQNQLSQPKTTAAGKYLRAPILLDFKLDSSNEKAESA